MRRPTLALAVALATITLAATTSSVQAAADLQFADWTATGGTTATGTLLEHTVTLTGWHLSALPPSYLDGTGTFFSAPYFTPPLPHSDAIEFRAEAGQAHDYTLSFGSPTTDPVLHLGSLGTTLRFPPGTSITRVSGKNDGFAVSGSTIIGAGDPAVDQYGLNDANGTVRLNGTFTSIAFTATTGYAIDGVLLQVGAPAPPAPTPTPTPTATPTATPSPPPPPPQTRNVTPPSIEAVRRVASGTEYRCNPGQWDGLVPGAAFGYAWYLSRLSSGLIGNGLTPSPPLQVGNTQTFTLASADFGKRYYCVVSVRDAFGRPVSAYSPTVLLSGRVETVAIVTHRAYGNVRVRGIDVYQVTQPVSWARMYRWPPGPGQDWFEPYCGAGTPTNYRSDPFTYAGADQVLRQVSFTQCRIAEPASYLKGDPARVTYAGVPLDQRKQTTAIVYVDVAGEAPSDPAQLLDLRLTARVGEQQIGEPKTAQMTNPPPSFAPWVSSEQRADSRYWWPVVLPPTWLEAAARTGRPLTLEARVSLPVGAGAGALVECLGLVFNTCAGDDQFTLTGVPVFDNLPDLTVKSLALVTNGQTAATLNSPASVLGAAQTLYPGGERLRIQPYSATVDISAAAGYSVTCGQLVPCTPTDGTSAFCAPYRNQSQSPAQNTRDCRQAAVDQELDRWWRKNPDQRTGYDVLMAVHNYPANSAGAEPGWTRPGTTIETPGQIPTIAVNDGTLGRPVTAAAHELGHAFGLPHSHTSSIEPLTGASCAGQPGELWPPDNTGRLQGVAFRGPSRLRFTPKVRVDVATRAGALFDLMSYCASGDANAWLSPRNWNRVFATLQRVAASRRAGAASSRSLTAARPALVLGVTGPAGAHITDVVPAAPGNLADPADASSPLRVRARDAAGTVIAESGAQLDPVGHNRDIASFAAAVPAATASVELLAAGAVIDRRTRTRAPRVRVTAPRPGASSGRRLTVRWTAAEPDHEPLHATIEYSPDGRNGWQTIYQGPSRGRAGLPGSFVQRSASARVRVTVDDGFNRASAVSGRFATAGSPPQATIVTPAAGEHVVAGAVDLAGTASDDRHRPMRGRSLTWFAGRTRLGHGERRVAHLRPGAVTLRLLARDRYGRTTVAQRRLTIDAPPLELTALDTPSRVPTRARTTRLRIATSAPAVMHAARHTWDIGKRPRTIAIPLPSRPRSGVLRLELRITAHASTLRQELFVIRVSRAPASTPAPAPGSLRAAASSPAHRTGPSARGRGRRRRSA